MPSGSSKRRKRRERRALAARADGGAADGRSGCLGSLGRGAPVEGDSQAGLRARLRRLLKEKLEYRDDWLADGDWEFEMLYSRVRRGESVLCEELQL